MIAPTVGDDAVVLGKNAEMRLPHSIVLKSAMNKDNGVALACLHIGEFRAVRSNTFDLVGSSGCAQPCDHDQDTESAPDVKAQAATSLLYRSS